MFWFTGYNGFQQFNTFIKDANNLENNDTALSKFTLCKDIVFKDVDITWSNLVTCDNNSATLYGFVDGKPHQSVSLNLPSKEEIVQLSCNKLNCVFVTRQGNCWQYCLKDKTWKDITNLYLTESSDQDHICKTVLGEIINAALTIQGRVFNIGSELTPPKVKVVDIACGKEHGILVTEDGAVFTWGGGSRGQLGNGTLESSEEPYEVDLLAGLKIVNVSAGGWHSAVLTKDGDLYTWGWNKQGQLGHPTLDANSEAGVAVLSEPRVVNWGDTLDVNVVQISCGASHTVALLDNGEIWGCGWNRWGQLGTDKFKFTDSMVKLDLMVPVPISKIICNAWNTIILAINENC